MAHSTRDEPVLCPFCGGEWTPSKAVDTQPDWVVVYCVACDATKMTVSGGGDPPPPS